MGAACPGRKAPRLAVLQLMLTNQASSASPTTAASSDQVMQDGAGRLLDLAFGQSPGLQMAWRRLPALRSDMERRSAFMSLTVVLPGRRANESLNCLC